MIHNFLRNMLLLSMERRGSSRRSLMGVVVGVGDVGGKGEGGWRRRSDVFSHITRWEEAEGGRGEGSGGTSQAPTSTFVIYGQHFVF